MNDHTENNAEADKKEEERQAADQEEEDRKCQPKKMHGWGLKLSLLLFMCACVRFPRTKIPPKKNKTPKRNQKGKANQNPVKLKKKRKRAKKTAAIIAKGERKQTPARILHLGITHPPFPTPRKKKKQDKQTKERPIGKAEWETRQTPNFPIKPTKRPTDPKKDHKKNTLNAGKIHKRDFYVLL